MFNYLEVFFLKKGSKVYLFLFIVFFAAHHFTYSQGETANWYFGQGAGIKFVKGSVKPVELSDNAMGIILNREGVASISDCQGNLLFYASGDTIWDKTHNVMLNGAGIGGNLSASQGILIVPQPNHDSIFYIFHSDAYDTGGVVLFNGSKGGVPLGVFGYSVVNINRNNGNGEVILKDSSLGIVSTEAINGVVHQNNKDVWVVAHEYGTDSFYSFLLTASGISDTVISESGPVIWEGLGYHKLSPAGKFIAHTYFLSGETGLFDFDDSTGVISNYLAIPSSIVFPYAFNNGISFSPQSTKLYVLNFGNLYQYDLSSGVTGTILASKTLVNPGNDLIGTMQLAPDCRLYIANTNGLSVVTEPENPGANCGFEYDKIQLTAGSTSITNPLPNFVESYFKGPGCISANFNYTQRCFGDTFPFFDASISSIYNPIYSRYWYFDDSLSENADTSTDLNPKHFFVSKGIHNVMLIISDSCGYHVDTNYLAISVTDQFISLGNDTTICSDGNDSLVLDTYLQNADLLWNTNDTNSAIIVYNSGEYFVSVTDSNGCQDSDSINIIFSLLPKINAGKDTLVCMGDTVRMNVSGGNTYLWSPGNLLNDDTIASPEFVPDTTITFIVGSPNQDGCWGHDSITVFVNNGNISTIEDTTIFEGTCIVLETTTDFSIQTNTWFPIIGLNDPNNLSPSVCPDEDINYYITITDSAGCVYIDSVSLKIIKGYVLELPSVFSPNEDQLNDEIKIIHSNIKGLEYFKIYTRWGELVFETNNIEQSWNGKFQDRNQEVGDYLYKISAITHTELQVSFEGVVTLIR